MLIELEISSPWMNAAGSLGFAPPACWNWVEPQGAFVTNPVSLSPRTPAQNRALLPYAGGFLLHSGLPNPGLNAVLRAHAAAWQRSVLPIWVHLLADQPGEIHQMALRLENVEGVAALEVGIPPRAEPALALELIQAALGELPVIAAIPLQMAEQPWLEQLAGLGLRALTLSAARGMLPGEKGSPIGGRLYGPGLYPLILSAIRSLRDLGLPLIAGAGIYSLAEGQTLLQAGASAIQVDSVLWQ